MASRIGQHTNAPKRNTSARILDTNSAGNVSANTTAGHEYASSGAHFLSPGELCSSGDSLTAIAK